MRCVAHHCMPIRPIKSLPGLIRRGLPLIKIGINLCVLRVLELTTGQNCDGALVV